MQYNPSQKLRFFFLIDKRILKFLQRNQGFIITKPILGGFPGGPDSKVSACNVGDPGSIPGLGRSPGEGNGLHWSTHSSTLAWKIPWTEEPSRLQSMGSQRVRNDWATSLSRQYWRQTKLEDVMLPHRDTYYKGIKTKTLLSWKKVRDRSMKQNTAKVY